MYISYVTASMDLRMPENVIHSPLAIVIPKMVVRHSRTSRTFLKRTVKGYVCSSQNAHDTDTQKQQIWPLAIVNYTQWIIVRDAQKLAEIMY